MRSSKPVDPAQTKLVRAQAIEHLELALTFTRQINASAAGSMIEMALYNLRADERPHDPDFLRSSVGRNQ
jgi:hypothetical protein